MRFCAFDDYWSIFPYRLGAKPAAVVASYSAIREVYRDEMLRIYIRSAAAAPFLRFFEDAQAP